MIDKGRGREDLLPFYLGRINSVTVEPPKQSGCYQAVYLFVCEH